MNQLIKAGYIKTYTEGMIHKVWDLFAQLPALVACCTYMLRSLQVATLACPSWAACHDIPSCDCTAWHCNIGLQDVQFCIC